jgi:adenylosuccinate synthase
MGRDLFRTFGRVPREPPPRQIIAISGPIRAGKTTLAYYLERRLGARVIRTREVLENEYGSDPNVRERRELQRLGEQLDRETAGTWVTSAVTRVERRLEPRRSIVLDSVRVPEQVQRLKEVPGFRVIHIYLGAPKPTLASRYPAGQERELPNYDEALKSLTEANVERMRDLTWLHLDTRWLRPSVTGALVLIAIRATSAARAVGSGLRWFGVGALIAGLCLWPLAWLLRDLEAGGMLVTLLWVVAIALFLMMATLIGAALTRGSPIERDPLATEGIRYDEASGAGL